MIDKNKYLTDREKYSLIVGRGNFWNKIFFDFYIDTDYLDKDIIRINYISEDYETEEEHEEEFEIDIESAYQFDLEREVYDENEEEHCLLTFKIRQFEWEIYLPLLYMEDFEKMIERRNNDLKMFDIVEIEERIIDMSIDDTIDVVVHLSNLPEDYLTIADRYISLEVDEKVSSLVGEFYVEEYLDIHNSKKYKNFIERSRMKYLMFKGRDELREISTIIREYNQLKKEDLIELLLSYKRSDTDRLMFKDWLIIKRIHKILKRRSELDYIDKNQYSNFINMIISRAYKKIPDKY
ncbi:hypothetical protein Q5L94_02155 [Idiomarina sp. Sol25]|uniref:hypothetical protein n=1 Tax=Idiomarina sp. Sol25 TaxID=3064000 RepID=UPI00294B8BFC|nr:hypothetical protein [Idiomarina sp. Sol25]MDV6326842.1 hypothetical protein [Idiomarina sp. Sol25]